jgi:hypothetical protein
MPFVVGCGCCDILQPASAWRGREMRHDPDGPTLRPSQSNHLCSFRSLPTRALKPPCLSHHRIAAPFRPGLWAINLPVPPSPRPLRPGASLSLCCSARAHARALLLSRLFAPRFPGKQLGHLLHRASPANHINRTTDRSTLLSHPSRGVLIGQRGRSAPPTAMTRVVVMLW